ncbi:DUF1800 domain-containing protein [Sphingomonas japonica]|uniref:Uncharacterized protein (DUF1800 family) n=1 Tax=Sphingomonas japonica TaxID=511662 RepID=A0ABX0U3M2_9SPHN|nr:DUF1800 domain-containing protein [Sphingomonas japonica]NIJ24276.1 uncharacterized protein (DUF1800 family) [Sphingomonas japonica]
MTPTVIAWNRFGLGARPGAVAPADAKRWLIDQFDRYEARPPVIAAQATTAQAGAAFAEYRAERRAARRMATDAGPLDRSARMAMRVDGRDRYRDAIGARANAAIVSDTPFAERLVHFWANHFAVSAEKLAVVGLAGAFEFDAIRPHVLGSFGAMLGAVERHPAMLLYLDQAQSVGPGSRVGQRVAAGGKRKRGINENLAREILELHTLGVGSGYDQSDVTEFARALTGWTVAGIGGRANGDPGGFAFAPAMHEPGARTILGARYAQDGEAQADAVLAALAVHPATARHVATKLARHFVADTPPPALVTRIEQAFLESNGDLPTIYRALIDAPEAWAPMPAKFKTPWEWSISAMRGLGLREIAAQQFAGLQQQLGQPVWRPGAPAGYDDIAGRWAAPDALVRRVEAAERLVSRAPSTIDARERSQALFADSLSAATQQQLARAESAQQALALMLVSPEFLRR